MIDIKKRFEELSHYVKEFPGIVEILRVDNLRTLGLCKRVLEEKYGLKVGYGAVEVSGGGLNPDGTYLTGQGVRHLLFVEALQNA